MEILNDITIYGVFGFILVCTQAYYVLWLFKKLDKTLEHNSDLRVWLEIEQHKNQTIFKKGYDAGCEDEREKIESEWRDVAKDELEKEAV